MPASTCKATIIFLCLSKIFDFGGAKKSIKVDKKRRIWLPYFKGCASKLDFTALLKSPLYMVADFWAEKSVNVDFRGGKVDKKSVLDPKVVLNQKVDFQYLFLLKMT